MTELLTMADDRTLSVRFAATRMLTEALAEPLSAEDQTVQSMPDVSPTKWHRAHTSWFFETFLLLPSLPGYEPFRPEFGYLFNSYYEGVGARYPRHQRGAVSRPGIGEIAEYRAYVDAAMYELLQRPMGPTALWLVELGIQHEQQHQELLLMDIKHVLSRHPLFPAYITVSDGPGDSDDAQGSDGPPSVTSLRPLGWHEYPEAVYEIGHEGSGFAFDNEGPRHRVLLAPFAVADRAVTCGEWLAFIDDGGYRRPELWLSDGWNAVETQGWNTPLYWNDADGGWRVFTLGGLTMLDPDQPVCHLSYYEADAFAHWAGARLPTEAEWEVAASGRPECGHFLDQASLHPSPVDGPEAEVGLCGDVWQWTASAYSPYPGFEVAPGAVGEYNGKFMVNQYVLRGGSCATPPGHLRTTYRNFFPPSARWAFSGLRLARDL